VTEFGRQGKVIVTLAGLGFLYVLIRRIRSGRAKKP
jgi:hypothetical protein